MTNPPSDLQPMPGQQLATISFQNRIWEVHLEFETNRSASDEGCRAKLVFTPSDGESGDTFQTAAIFIEDTFEQAVKKAQEFQRQGHQLKALLRSIMP